MTPSEAEFLELALKLEITGLDSDIEHKRMQGLASHIMCMRNLDVVKRLVELNDLRAQTNAEIEAAIAPLDEVAQRALRSKYR